MSETKGSSSSNRIGRTAKARATEARRAAGSRVRITLAFADTDNFETPIPSPAPTVHILRDAAHASYLELPFMPPAEAR